MELDLRDATLPSMITNSGKQMRFGDNFTIRAIIQADLVAGKQTIFSKCQPSRTGNAPGIKLMLRGTTVTLWTFADGDDRWEIACSGRGYLQAGEWYDILVIRSADMAQIYINNVDRTHPLHAMVSSGDLNCDADAYIGIDTLMDRAGRKFYGKIAKLAFYNQRKVRP